MHDFVSIQAHSSTYRDKTTVGWDPVSNAKLDKISRYQLVGKRQGLGIIAIGYENQVPWLVGMTRFYFFLFFFLIRMKAKLSEDFAEKSALRGVWYVCVPV